MIKLLLKLFGGRVKLIKLDREGELDILRQMAKIEKIEDYWELQRQAGYQLFGKTEDRKYLGMVVLAETILTLMRQKSQPEEEQSSDGYESTV